MRILVTMLFTVLLIACTEEIVVIKENVRPVAWLKVSESPLEQIRTLSGIVASVEEANLSFEVSGKVEKVNVTLGSSVEKGQVLAQLNQRTFLLQRQSAEAELEQKEASKSEAYNEYQRYAKLIEKGLVSQSGYDTAKGLYDSAKSLVDVAKAQLNIAKKNLQDSVLIAPYQGVITKRLIEPSQQIATGQSAFEIEGKHGLEIRVLVPETLIQKLQPNSITNVRFPALANSEMKGKITEIGTRAVSANAYPIIVLLQTENSQLFAGMTAEVDFYFIGDGLTGFQGNAIVVPFTAIIPASDQTNDVFVYDPKTQLIHKRKVQIENVMGKKLFISAGLKSGEIIITAGVSFLRENQKVQLLDDSIQRFN